MHLGLLCINDSTNFGQNLLQLAINIRYYGVKLAHEFHLVVISSGYLFGRGEHEEGTNVQS
jgi:hypothetical protein